MSDAKEVQAAVATYEKLAAHYGRLRTAIESGWIGGAAHGVVFSAATRDNDLLITSFARLLRVRFEVIVAHSQNRKLMGTVKFSVPITESNGASGFDDIYVIYFDALGNAYLDGNKNTAVTTVGDSDFSTELGFRLASHMLNSKFLVDA